jgi:hypothetical protein
VNDEMKTKQKRWLKHGFTFEADLEMGIWELSRGQFEGGVFGDADQISADKLLRDMYRIQRRAFSQVVSCDPKDKLGGGTGNLTKPAHEDVVFTGRMGGGET